MGEWSDWCEMREYNSRTPEQKKIDEIVKILKDEDYGNLTKITLIEKVIYAN